MSSSYYVTYGTDRLTFGGSGSVAWNYDPVIPVTRYEYKLWTTPDGSGKRTGTLPSALSSFDSYIVAYGIHNAGWTRQYQEFAGSGEATVGVQCLMSDDWAYYMGMSIFSSNATSWQIVNNTSNCGWWMDTRTGQNNGWSAGGYPNKLNGVYEIIGVKYQ